MTEIAPELTPADERKLWLGELSSALGLTPPAEPEKVRLREAFTDAKWYTTRGDTCFVITTNESLAWAIRQAGGWEFKPPYPFVPGGVLHHDLRLPNYLVPLIRPDQMTDGVFV